MITVVDYGLGNIQAFLNVFKRQNIEARSASAANELEGATRLILPGVGAFDHAMELLDASGMRTALEVLVMERRVPVLGVCVGMQILARGSDEGHRTGLGWIDGHVHGFAAKLAASPLPLPHMGWNDVQPMPGERLFDGMQNEARFYFLHSYYFECADPADSAATSHYGIEFSCAVRHAHIAGVQFHPEKSHHWGTALLRNFALQA